MKTITIYDPAMCCSTGVCGPNVDPALAQFAAMLNQMKERGVVVERHNLAQDPMAFARDARIREILEKDGAGALPVIFVDGMEYLRGRYPDHEERANLCRGAKEAETALS